MSLLVSGNGGNDMPENQSSTVEVSPHQEQFPKPDPALKRLDKLIGTWELTGRTLDAKEDNITGRTTIAWIMGGFFLELRGEMEFMGTKFESLEIIGYDPVTHTFPATVFSSMEGITRAYFWDVQGDVVTHWTEGSKYTGTFSDKGNTLAGGWRPAPGVEQNGGNTYDATMIRVK
jgi:hypothetical protein